MIRILKLIGINMFASNFHFKGILEWSAAHPFCPYIIIDDTILVGHYAHARIKAPIGLWMEISNPKILEMCAHDLAHDTEYSDSLDNECKAISRYIENFQYALNTGRKLMLSTTI